MRLLKPAQWNHSVAIDFGQWMKADTNMVNGRQILSFESSWKEFHFFSKDGGSSTPSRDIDVYKVVGLSSFFLPGKRRKLSIILSKIQLAIRLWTKESLAASL